VIDAASSIVATWLPRYPTVRPWVDDEARSALRLSEDTWLAGFAGLDSLTRAQVTELIDWKWQGYRPQRSRATYGAGRDWDHTSSRVAQALTQADDGAAVDALRDATGGIPNWQTAMASVVLAACRPDRFTIADSRALRTLMLLEGKPDRLISRTNYFPRSRWDSYLAICRELQVNLHVSLRDRDRAFWAAAGRHDAAVPVEHYE
jgi:hypothetical protein